MVSYPIVNGKPTKDPTYGKIAKITIDIEGESVLADFVVIEIVDDNNPYPTLLGIDWATDMNGVINLKKCKMNFEKNYMCSCTFGPYRRIMLHGASAQLRHR